MWSVGSQEALYGAGPWVKQGKNIVVVLVFDLNGEAQRTLHDRETPMRNQNR